MRRIETAVHVEGLTKKYGSFTAVNNISFDVLGGEVIAILGPNGAGKTSTIEMMEGFRNPTAGVLEVLGCQPRQGGRDWRAKIGMVLQSTSLDGELTIKELLSMYEQLYTNPRSIEEVLDLVGLKDCAQRRVGHLSGGQQRRVDVAIGIIGRPQLLFLDEPTTGFDPVARRDSWKMVQTLCQEGMTVILTTHYMDEAQYLADRILVFVNGTIVANAAPDALSGTSKQKSTIGFLIPSPSLLETLPATLKSIISLNGNSVKVITEHVQQVIELLTQWAHKHRLELTNLTIARPSLEDIYLQLVHANSSQQGASA